MATFAHVHPPPDVWLTRLTCHSKKTFDAAGYAAARPSYPKKLYKLILDYHKGRCDTCLDLGCGHGVVARQFAVNFVRFLGTDPSAGMIKQAVEATSRQAGCWGVKFQQAFAEDDVPLGSGEVDVVTAAQASHWFDQSRLWPRLRDKVRSGGTLAFWGYKDPVFVDYPRSTKIVDDYAYSTDKSKMGVYWPPGREIVRDHLRAVRPPDDEWEDIRRIEYEPGTGGANTGQGTMLVGKKMKVGEFKAYVRTWSPVHAWKQAHAGKIARNKGGEGDIADILFDELAVADPIMGQDEAEVQVEWGSALILARRR